MPRHMVWFSLLCILVSQKCIETFISQYTCHIILFSIKLYLSKFTQ